MERGEEGNEGLTTATGDGSGGEGGGAGPRPDEAAALPAPAAGSGVAPYVRLVGQEPELVWLRALGLAGVSVGRPDMTGNYTVNCPGHDDRVESLRWSVTADGRVLVKCQATCTTEQVVAALGLQMHQLNPMKTEYYWCGVADEGLADVVVAAHVREYKLGEGPKFIWTHHLGGDVWDAGRGEAEIEPLWRGPELRAWAAAGGDELWLTEGEKDAYFAELQFEADREARKPPPGAEGRIATTGGGGANQDPERVANAIADLCVGRRVRVIVVGDNDPAGRKRVARLVAAVGPSLIADGSSVEILYPPEDVRDLAQTVDYHGTKWRSKMVVGEITDEDLELEDPYSVACVQNGMLVHATPPESETPVLCAAMKAKAAKGREVEVDLGVLAYTYTPVLAVAPEVVEVEVDPEGTHAAWTVQWAEIETGEIRRFRIEAGAIASVQTWASGVAVPTGGALALLGGRGGASVGQLAAWLRWHASRLTPTMVRPVCGWNQQDREWHFAGYEGPVIGTGQAIRADKTRALWRYGLMAPETEDATGEAVAAAQVAELVWFRRPEESCVLLAALAANAVRPVADQVAGMVRVVSVHGLSNTGKTTYLRLALRAFGSLGYGQSNTTEAAFGRDTATGTGPYWLDDEAGPAMDAILAQIRGAATGGGRVRAKADTDGATIEQKSEALIVISAEAESRGEEKAMRDRMVSVEFTERAQDRMSRTDPTRPQWDDMLKLGAGDLYDHETLTDYAGWTVRGLWGATKGISWDERVGAPTGAREARVGRFLRVGAVVLSDWLRTWGYEEEADLIESTVAREAAEREALSRELAYAGLDTYAATELLPRALASASATKTFTVTASLWNEVTSGRTAISTILGLACQEGYGSSAGNQEATRTKAPALIRIVTSGIVDPEASETVFVAVRGRELYLWATSDEGRKAGVSDDVRNVGKNAIESQVAGLCTSDPETGKPFRYVAKYKGGAAEYRAMSAAARGVILGTTPLGVLLPHRPN